MWLNDLWWLDKESCEKWNISFHWVPQEFLTQAKELTNKLLELYEKYNWEHITRFWGLMFFDIKWPNEMWIRNDLSFIFTRQSSVVW